MKKCIIYSWTSWRFARSPHKRGFFPQYRQLKTSTIHEARLRPRPQFSFKSKQNSKNESLLQQYHPNNEYQSHRGSFESEWSTKSLLLLSILFICSGGYRGHFRHQGKMIENRDPYLLYLDDGSESESLQLSEDQTKWKEEEDYLPLKRRSEIRLLVLHPEQGDDEVSCELAHFLLSPASGGQAPSYEALSYVWGNAQSTRSIHCGKRKVAVTMNLYEALQTLRLNDQERVLWVDALCINQKDVQERTQQVRIMGEIYSRAKGVLVWLGKDRSSDDALSELYKIARFLHDEQHNLKTLEFDWKPITELFSYPWFHRVWVIQEIARAKRVIIYRGHNVMLWGDFIDAAKWIQKSAALPDIVRQALRSLMVMHDIRHHFQNRPLIRKPRASTLELLQLVLATQDFLATDPRDKLFALIGLATDVRRSDWEITPDYTLSVEEVYKRFALWSISRRSNLLILSFGVDRGKMSPVGEELPSWIPDLSRPDGAKQLPELPYLDLNAVNFVYDSVIDAKYAIESKLREIEHFHADYVPLAGFLRRFTFSPPQVAFSDGSKVIHIAGIKIDSIKSLEATPPKHAEKLIALNTKGILESNQVNLDNVIAAYSKIKYALCLLDEMAIPKLDSEYFENWWRTLMCNMTENGKVAPQSFGDIIKGVLKHSRDEIPGNDYEIQVVDNLEDRGELQISKFEPSSDKIQEIILQRYLSGNAGVVGAIATWSKGRRMGTTAAGRFTHVPNGAKVGDIICIFKGARTPYVVRSCENGYYQLVGQCYVHGIMHGEARASGEKRNFPLN